MKRILSSIVPLAAVSIFAAACGFEHSASVLGPTAAAASTSTPNAGGSSGGTTSSSNSSMVGTWTSNALPAQPAPNTCGNFQYIVTSQTATTITGTFTALCSGGITLAGNGTGQLNGTAVTISVSGTATMPGGANCAISLSGNGTLEDNGNTLRVPFTGTTCQGPVTGIEVLRKPQVSAPEIGVLQQPTTTTPTPNQILTALRTRFTVNNVARSGPVGSVVYEFEVAHDEPFTKKFGGWNVPEQTNETALDLPIDLAWVNVYYWHVRAFDGAHTSPWSTTRSFATSNPPPPPPPPSWGGDPTVGCKTGDHQKLVECIHDHINPSRTVEGAFDVTKWVAWALRGEGAGLLIKNAGENITSWSGYSFAAARICYPDGHIYKVLTDVPSTNGASWQDNGFVERNLYVPAINPNR